jgi:hypothetical protein
MAEPVSATAASTAAVQVGLAALLVGALGEVGADVMMVALAALAGCFISLSNDHPPKQILPALFFIAKGICISLVLAWAVSSVAAHIIPALATPYAPAIVAFCIGFLGDGLGSAVNKLLVKVGIK